MWNRRSKTLFSLLLVAVFLMLEPIYSLGNCGWEKKVDKTGSARYERLTGANMPEALAQSLGLTHPDRAGIDKEDAERLDSVTVINGNGSKTTHIFNRPVKYIDQTDNTVRFIDNSFKTSYKPKGLFGTYAYENAQSDAKLYLPVKIKDGLLLETGDLSLKMAPGAKKNSKAQEREYKFAGQTQRVIEYPDAFGKGAHLQYAAVSGGFKENILLERFDGVSQFEFKLSIPGYYAVLSGRGVKINIYAYADGVDAKPMYSISQPYAIDSFEGEADGAEHVAWDNRYELMQTGQSEYIVKMIIDREFLESESTVYPVLIDPTTALASSGAIEDTYVCEANGMKYNNDSLLRIGADADPLYGRMSIYLKNNFMWYFRYIRPENVTMAKYRTERVGISTASGISVGVYDSNEVYALGQVTYGQLESGTGGFQSNAILDIAHIQCEFDMTGLIKKWLKNLICEGGKAPEYGVIIKAAPGTSGYMSLRSADDPSGTYPCFEITYNEDTSVASGQYFIRNKYSGQYLDVYNSGIASDTNVIQFPFNGGANQIWQVTGQNGLYTISPAHTSGMYLQSAGGQNTDGNNVVQGAYNTSYPYYLWWRLVKNGNGTYRIMPYISTILALDNGSSLSNGGNVYIGDYRGWESQQWVLEALPTGVEILTDYVTVGQSIQLAANVLPATASQQVTWTIPAGQADMATVTSDGILTATARGSIIVQAQTTNGIVCTKNILIAPIMDDPENKPFKADYAYQNMPSNAGEAWYNNLLSTYDLKYRHEIIFRFNYEEFYQALQDIRNTVNAYEGDQINNQYWQNFINMMIPLVDYIIGTVPIVGDIYSFMRMSADMTKIGTSDMEYIRQVMACMDQYAYKKVNGNNVPQTNQTFEIRVLFDTLGVKQIYLTRYPDKNINEGDKFSIPYLFYNSMGENQYEVYNYFLNVFSNRAGRITTYKVAPGVSYAFPGWSDLG